MAVKPLTLQERIKQSQALAKSSTSQLAAEQGLAVAPVSAVGTGTIGGTPQQQAMAGTPAQKKGALAAATEKVAAPGPETGLEQAMKVKPQTALDTAKAKEMDRFSTALGTFGDKVNQWIEGVVSAVTTGPAGLRATLQLTDEQKKAVTDTVASLPPEAQGNAQTRIDDALAYLSSQAGGMADETRARQAIQTLNEMLGRDTTSALLAGTEYAGLWQDINKTISGQLETGIQAAARGPDSKLTLQDITTLGTTPDEISSLLGISPEQVSQLTLGQFQQQLQGVGQRQFGQTQQVSANIASALVSETEREALRGTMRELEEAGIAGVEAQFQQLVNDIEQGATIDIGGKTYSVEEFLAEGTISDIASQYYAGDKEMADRLAKEEPQLKAWLDSNRTGLIALIDAGAGRSQELKTHNETQDQVRQIVQAYPDLVKQLKLDQDEQYRPGFVMPVGKNVDWSKGGTALQGILTGLDPSQRPTALANLSSTLASAASANLPSEVEVLKNTDPNLFLDGELVANYNGNITKYKAAQKTLASNDPIAVLNSVLENDIVAEDIQAILEQDAYLVGLGQEPSQWWKLTGGDGRLDLADAQAIAKSSIKPPSLAGTQKNDKFGMDSVRLPSSPPPISGPLADFTNRFYDDKRVTADEILNSYREGEFSIGQLLGMYKAMGRPGPDDKSPIKRAMYQAYAKARDEEVAKEYSALGLESNGFTSGLENAINNAVIAYSTPGIDNLGAFSEVKAVVKGTVDSITRLLNQEKNPDMRWKYQQDIATIQNTLAQAEQRAASQVQQQAIQPSNTKLGDVEQAFTDIGTGLGDIIRDTAVTPVEKAASYVGKKIKLKV